MPLKIQARKNLIMSQAVADLECSKEVGGGGKLNETECQETILRRIFQPLCNIDYCYKHAISSHCIKTHGINEEMKRYTYLINYVTTSVIAVLMKLFKYFSILCIAGKVYPRGDPPLLHSIPGA